MICAKWKDYEVIACGDGEKLERWGEVYLLRPDPQAIWPAPFPLASFDKLHAHYRRDGGGGRWENIRPFPSEWIIGWNDVKFLIKPMGFKHTGLFPEQAVNWEKTRAVADKKPCLRVLNLFGYTGGVTVALAKHGVAVTHVDAAKGMVERCRQNAAASEVESDRIRYIVDDCKKFVQREIKRGKIYDAVIMDPPSYGRGPGGETWKLEDGVYALAELAARLVPDPEFFLINSYTTGLQPQVIKNILEIALAGRKGVSDAYEIGLPVSENQKIVLPCGCSGLWTKE